MTCKHCGCENDKTAMYCDNCYEPLDDNDPPLPLLFEWLEGT